ncbi:hypothetical protein A203_12970 [Chromobacterium violaceum]|uniref:Uncharacterized protein n=1 Tax=Chromobacterium violaceum TaxID=536 RepID=A0A381EY71_CHRVL|nr:Uncharacterised protein [Chromobacterium violaceum]SUX33483.1 Uncharacterised protein [Chromobacterium violaceum]SUX88751.1 Uncharacterised protein [Chromobacterium violaceum]VEB41530.1 Uncharacterised protein [Chromobacterium violaceum]
MLRRGIESEPEAAGYLTKIKRNFRIRMYDVFNI